MKRLLTAAIAVPLSLLAIFCLDARWFFAVCALTIGWAAYEFSVIARSWAGARPMVLLPCLALLLGALLSFARFEDGTATLLAGAGALTVGLGSFVLLSRTPIAEAPAALGTLTFGTLYFAVPMASLVHLQRQDPWLVGVLVAIVWLGDTAALLVGTAWGRHRLAPTVSPKKTWEGAAAGLLVGLAAAATWSFVRLDRLEPSWLLLGAITAVAAQLGDLVESIFKRASGIKDSGRILPGHGGALDRADALLFAAPVFWFGWSLLAR